MELIERYLQAVKFWLPKQQKHDIIAELSEDIHAQVEEREAELGRKLNETELVTLLQQRGAPVLVANRYLPQEQLIGPLLFPIYRFVLKIVMLCYLVPWIFVWFGLAMFGPDPAGPETHSWAAHVSAFWGSFWLAAFVSVGVVTIVFAVLERVHAQTRFLAKWDPRKLPPVRNPNQIPRSASIVEIVANLVFAAWWITCMFSPMVLNHPQLRVWLLPSWPYFFWGFLLLALGNTALAGVNLMRPYATVLRSIFRLASNAAGSVLFCWLLKANPLAGIAAPNLSAAKALEFTNAINWWTAKMFPAALIVGVVIVAVDVYRIARVRSGKLPLARATAMITTMLLLAGGASGQPLNSLRQRKQSSSEEPQRVLTIQLKVEKTGVGMVIEFKAPAPLHTMRVGRNAGPDGRSDRALNDASTTDAIQ